MWRRYAKRSSMAWLLTILEP
ncbi:hypothetical protein CFP56_041269 [Quercus suber]|uniref:Uncharacterized protein n=1 Tax=Quercus suber TaxID=58331 RepID=A0AAW0LJ75_QUESU